METWVTLWIGLLWASAAAFLAVTIFILATSVRGFFAKATDRTADTE